jgi:hypothetical protein
LTPPNPRASRLKASLSPAILTVLAIPLIQLLARPAWMYNPDGWDQWFYYGFFQHLRHHMAAFGGSYFSTRLALILPGYAAHSLLGPLTANFCLRLYIYWVAILSLYFLVRRSYGQRCAVICCLLLSACADFLLAVGWDYIDGPGIAYGLLCLEELSASAAAAASSRRTAAWRAGFAGMAFGAAMHVNLFLTILAPVLAVVFLARAGRQTGGFLALPALGGLAALTGCLGLVNVALGGPFLFFVPSIAFGGQVIKTHPDWASPLVWAAGAWWLVIPFAVALACVLFLARMAARGGGDDESRPGRMGRMADASSLPLLLLIFGGLTAQHFHALQASSYANYLLVFTPLSVAALIGRRLDLWPRTGFLCLASAAACLAVAVGADVPSHLPRAIAVAYTSVRALPNVSAVVLAAALAAGIVLGGAIRQRIASAIVVSVVTGAVLIHLGGPRLREAEGGALSRASFLDVDRMSREFGRLTHEQALWFWYKYVPGDDQHYTSFSGIHLWMAALLGKDMPDTANLRTDVLHPGTYVALMDDRESVVEQGIAELRGRGIALSRVARLRSTIRPAGFGVELLRVRGPGEESGEDRGGDIGTNPTGAGPGFMLRAILCMLLACAAAVGAGSSLARFLRIHPNAGERGLLGLLCFGILAACVHFFIPVYPAVQYTLLVLGLIGFAICRTDLGGLPALGCAVLAFASVFFHPAPVLYHDNGLYHVPTLLWNTRTALTPGLANLHGRLGFNSLLFLIAPIVATPALGWITNALVAGFTLLACLGRLRHHASREASAIGFWFLVVAVAVATFNAEFTQWLGVLNSDGVVAALIVYWAFLLFEYEQGMRPDTTPSLLLLLAAFAAMTKFGSVPALAVSAVLIGSAAGGNAGPATGAMAWRRSLRPPRRVLVAVAAFLAIWTARGFLLSGCAAYPIPQTCAVSLPWAVSAERAVGESDGIRSWARSPGRLDYQAVIADWRWLGPWLDEHWNRTPFPELRWALLLGICAIGCRFLARKKTDPASPRIAAILAGGIAFWFWAAPDPRFGIGFLAAMGILSVAVAAGSLVSWQSARLAAIAVLLAGVAAWTVRAAAGDAWRKLPAIPPLAPKLSLITIDGPWGVPVRVPGEPGDQCWDAPLPCLPWYYFDPAALRKVMWRTLRVHPSVPAAQAAAHLRLPLRIDSGGAAYTDSQGRSWLPDVGSVQGWPISTEVPVSGTSDPALYRTSRYGGTGRLDYQFRVPNGDYVVTLKFAEILYAAAGTRVFDIALSGAAIRSHFDIFAAAGGANKAFDLSCPVRVTDRQLTIALTGLVGEPMINALEVRSGDPHAKETWAIAGPVRAHRVSLPSPSADTLSPAAGLLDYDLDGLLAHAEHTFYGKAPAKPPALPRGVFKVTGGKDHFATGFQPVAAPGTPTVTAVEVSVTDQPDCDRFGTVNMVLQNQDFNTLYWSGTLPDGEDHTLVALPAGTRSVRVAFLANDQGYIRFPTAVRLRAFTGK